MRLKAQDERPTVASPFLGPVDAGAYDDPKALQDELAFLHAALDTRRFVTTVGPS